MTFLLLVETEEEVVLLLVKKEPDDTCFDDDETAIVEEAGDEIGDFFVVGFLTLTLTFVGEKEGANGDIPRVTLLAVVVVVVEVFV